jgi:tRNA A37 threonylcarbamoyladenosine modification protein TsaB
MNSAETLIIDRSSMQTLIAFAGETLTVDGRDDTWVAQLKDFLAGRQPKALAVGLGPGSFAGIRAAIACLQGLGIVWGIQPVGFPSAAIYAYASKREDVTVIGDARRQTLWSIRYRVDATGITPLTPFRLLQQATFQPDATMVSPDAQRLTAFGIAGVTITAEDLAPTLERLTTPPTTDPLPIYLHPAVGVARAEG